MNDWVPNSDMYVTDDTLVVKVELAGMSREHLEISIDDNHLMICGQRPDGCRAPKCTFLVVEIAYGTFERAYDIPPGYDLSKAQATYQNGFLRVEVPAISSAVSASTSASSTSHSKTKG